MCTKEHKSWLRGAEGEVRRDVEREPALVTMLNNGLGIGFFLPTKAHLFDMLNFDMPLLPLQRGVK